jgi:MFS family permease
MRSSYLAIVGALLIAEIAAIFETSMIYVALPTLIREFGDPVTAGWLVTSHGLIGTSAALMAGRLGDIYGRKRILLVMLALAVAGSLLSAVTSNFALVLVGRSLQGLSAALIPLSIGIIRESLSKDRVPVAIGLMTTGAGMGTALGLVLGGWIVDTFHWQTLFGVSAVLLAVSWVVIKVLIPASSGDADRLGRGPVACAGHHRLAARHQFLQEHGMAEPGGAGSGPAGPFDHGLLGPTKPRRE